MFTLVLYLAGVIAYALLYQSWLREKRARASLLTGLDTSVNRRLLRYQSSSVFDAVAEQWRGVPTTESFEAFADRFNTFEDVVSALRSAGFDKCHVIVALDFSASNEWQGRRSYSRRCLHDVLPGRHSNPYQQVLAALASTLSRFNVGQHVHAFGFGDVNTKNKSVFYFRADDKPCRDFAEIIITDGQFNDAETLEALVEASHYPLSVIVVGVGDGPWMQVTELDDQLPMRRFDNLQFVDFNSAILGTKGRHGRNDALARFALQALMELPDQYKAIRKLRLLP